MTAAGCRLCAGPMPEAKDRGRSAVYCSTSCRRAAEYRIRRLSTRLEARDRHRLRLLLDLEVKAPYAVQDLRRQLRIVEDSITDTERDLEEFLIGLSAPVSGRSGSEVSGQPE